MAGLIPFNRTNFGLTRSATGFEDFFNMFDDFFSDSWRRGRGMLNDTFKIDIEEADGEYRIEAELPGVKKEEIELSVEDDNLCISVNRSEEINKDGKTYIHRERRANSMSRKVHLDNARLSDVKAKLEEGVLIITVPVDEKAGASRKINIE